MPIKNFSSSDILKRIVLTLPTRFTIDAASNLYSFFAGISEALKLDEDLVDELFRQTALVSASGAYVDDYITSLSKIGRYVGETDANYKKRYNANEFIYNCTKRGIQQIVIDITGLNPVFMYSGSQRGCYYDDDHYYDDLFSLYGFDSSTAFKGYIVLHTKPPEPQFTNLCKTISAAKASGTIIYLIYSKNIYYDGNYNYDGSRDYGI